MTCSLMKEEWWLLSAICCCFLKYSQLSAVDSEWFVHEGLLCMMFKALLVAVFSCLLSCLHFTFVYAWHRACALEHSEKSKSGQGIWDNLFDVVLIEISWNLVKENFNLSHIYLWVYNVYVVCLWHCLFFYVLLRLM